MGAMYHWNDSVGKSIIRADNGKKNKKQKLEIE